FVDSKPGGADIYLNQIHRDRTSARFVLPAGNYSLTLRKDGYRDWSRSFTLDEQTVSRYIYPFLFPQKPQPHNLKLYNNSPGVITQTPDRHWLLVQSAPISLGKLTFDEYDTFNIKKTARAVILPAALLTSPAAPASRVKVVEWSTDNVHLLLQHT